MGLSPRSAHRGRRPVKYGGAAAVVAASDTACQGQTGQRQLGAHKCVTMGDSTVLLALCCGCGASQGPVVYGLGLWRKLALTNTMLQPHCHCVPYRADEQSGLCCTALTPLSWRRHGMPVVLVHCHFGKATKQCHVEFTLHARAGYSIVNCIDG